MVGLESHICATGYNACFEPPKGGTAPNWSSVTCALGVAVLKRGLVNASQSAILLKDGGVNA